MPENGEAKAGELNVDQVVLTRDRKTGAFTIGGNVQDIDLSLNMLAQATRHLDVQFRIVAAVEAQRQIKEQQADFERVQRLLGKA
jgi:allophanate hydrolase subunit 2